MAIYATKMMIPRNSRESDVVNKEIISLTNDGKRALKLLAEIRILGNRRTCTHFFNLIGNDLLCCH
jgi:hypothetical protein